MQAHLLNLDNDGALAADRHHYTPPRHALAIERDLELLPLWWASPGDAVIATSHTPAEIAAAAALAGVSPGALTAAHRPAPWGWSRSAATRLLQAGVNPSLLPSEDALAMMRRLSHRATAIEVCRLLEQEWGFECPNAPRLLTRVSEHDLAGGVMLKRPWSGSGRGVFPTDAMQLPQALRLARGIAARQGSVVVERLLGAKREDLSMLFYCDGAEARLAGYGRFLTQTDGRYLGSLIMPQASIAAAFPHGHERLARALASILTRLVASRGYEGWAGVDMMTCGPERRLVPCVEVNLRMTMGVVAMLLSRRQDAHPALLRVEPMQTPPEPAALILASGHDFRIVAAGVPPEVPELTPAP